MSSSTRIAGSALGSVGGSLAATRDFLRGQLWVWPVLAALFLSLFGWWVRGTIEKSTRDKMASDTIAHTVDE